MNQKIFPLIGVAALALFTVTAIGAAAAEGVRPAGAANARDLSSDGRLGDLVRELASPRGGDEPGRRGADQH